MSQSFGKADWETLTEVLYYAYTLLYIQYEKVHRHQMIKRKWGLATMSERKDSFASGRPSKRICLEAGNEPTFFSSSSYKHAENGKIEQNGSLKPDSCNPLSQQVVPDNRSGIFDHRSWNRDIQKNLTIEADITGSRTQTCEQHASHVFTESTSLNAKPNHPQPNLVHNPSEKHTNSQVCFGAVSLSFELPKI